MECPSNITDVGRLTSLTQLPVGAEDNRMLLGCAMGNWVLVLLPAAASVLLRLVGRWGAADAVAAVAGMALDVTGPGTAECSTALVARADSGHFVGALSLTTLCCVTVVILVVGRLAPRWADTCKAYDPVSQPGLLARLTAPRYGWSPREGHERVFNGLAFWFDGYRPQTAMEHGIATMMGIASGSVVGWARDEAECAGGSLHGTFQRDGVQGFLAAC
eukprot:TRINITY_DN10891_c0_g1_i2.p5 TRINITY_DN10891_c0_g1~~TRINITY_DN10891_c0_g1_i2.p5  ORF type:complete len:218 (+),score=18.01 TRINITY_DN10891_c0_g1_i2:2164-2817(+)